MPRGLERDVLPRRYGKYELLERIGEGGMAEAYRARLPGAAGFEKTVVIKRILPHLAENPRFVKMFVNEAKLASRIQHQNVVQVFELDQSPDGELYMVLEHVAGLDLRAILEMAAERVLRLPLWFSVYTLHRVLSGLAHAHELIDEAGERLSIIHRDVTPSNVFVSWLGEVKIADFGVAKAIGSVEVDATDTTLRGQLKGKLSYAPPEQIHGEELDARADVFSAGVVLWECLTQRRLFGGRADFETMLAICEEPRTPPSAFNPAVPPELDAIVLRALERDRQQRHGSAHELAEDLEQALGLLRSRVVPGDVRHVLEVLRGKKPLHPELGADLPDERRESDPVPLLKRRRTSSDPAPASDRGAAARVAYETGEVWQSEPPPGIVDDLRVATPAPLAEVRRATMTPTVPAELPPRPASRAPSGPRAPAAAPPPSPAPPPVARAPSGALPSPPRGTPLEPLPSPPRGTPLEPRRPAPARTSTSSAPPALATSSSILAAAPPPLSRPPSAAALTQTALAATAISGVPGPAPRPSSAAELTPPMAPSPALLTAAGLPPSLFASGPPGADDSGAFAAVGPRGADDSGGFAIPPAASTGRGRGGADDLPRWEQDPEPWSGSGPYVGATPFFARTTDGSTRGPLEYRAFVRFLETKEARGASVSADGDVWIPAQTFAALAGLDGITRQRPRLTNVTAMGTLEETSLIALFTKLALAGTSGRLVVLTGANGTARRDVDLVRGAPADVWTDRPDLQLPALAERRELITRERIPELVHLSLRELAPLDEALRTLTNASGRYRPIFMRDRLVELLRWRQGKFALDAVAVDAPPFAASLLSSLVDLVARAWTDGELLSRLDPVLGARLAPTPEFAAIVPALDLSKALEVQLDKLVDGKSLVALSRRAPGTPVLALGLVLLDSGAMKARS